MSSVHLGATPVQSSLYWFLEAIEVSSLPPPVIKNSMNVRNSNEEIELANSISMRTTCLALVQRFSPSALRWWRTYNIVPPIRTVSCGHIPRVHERLCCCWVCLVIIRRHNTLCIPSKTIKHLSLGQVKGTEISIRHCNLPPKARHQSGR